jgi:transposase
LRNWVRQADIDQHRDPTEELTSAERKELSDLCRELKRVQMERDFLTAGASSRQSRPTHCLKKAATFFAQESSDPMS